MWIQNNVVTASAVSGWMGLTKASAISLTIQLDPTSLTHSGKSTIKRWIRNGWCNRGKGYLNSYWTSLMYLAGARYLMVDDGHDTFTQIFDSGITKKCNGKSAFIAMFKLLREANPDVLQQYGAYEQVNLTHNNENYQGITLPITSMEMTSTITFRGTQRQLIREAFFNQFDHPLVSIEDTLQMVEQRHEFHYTVRQRVGDKKEPFRRFTNVVVEE